MTPEMMYILDILADKISIGRQRFRIEELLPLADKVRIYKKFREEFPEVDLKIKDMEYITDHTILMGFSRAVSLSFEFESLGCKVSITNEYDEEPIARA